MRNNENYSRLFDATDTKKQWVIEVYSGSSKVATITNEELRAEGVVLTESICEQSELRFGGCIASEFQFTISNSAYANTLKGLKIKVYIKLDGDTEEGLYIGEYYVESDQVAADSTTRKVICYDKLAWLLGINVDEWYEALFPTDETTVTLLALRNSLWTYLGYPQETITLVNDTMTIGKTLDGTGLTASVVIKAICEINGVFGQIRQGKFRYIGLVPQDELYPADDLFPANDLYPKGAGSTRYMSELNANALYLGGKFESFEAKPIEAVTIREQTGDVGVTVGSGNAYIIQGNFLCYGKGTTELTPIAQKVLATIKDLSYTPFSLYAQANLCYETGDGLIIQTRNGIYKTFMLMRTCQGAQYLMDEYTAEGKEEQEVEEYSASEQIMQLQSKSNVLERTIEQTQSTITDTAAGLQSQITQNAGEISLKVSTSQYTASVIVSKINGGTVQINAAKINFTGFSTFARTADLSAGTTTIDGDCIKTGTISANRIDVDNLKIKTLYSNDTSLPVIQTVNGKTYFGGNGYDKLVLSGYSVEIGASANLSILNNKVEWSRFGSLSADDYVLTVSSGGEAE